MILAVDVSGSMSGVAMSDIKKYLSNLIHQLSDDNHIMLLTFGDEIKNVVSFTQNRDLIYSQLDGLKAVEKKTILYQAIIDGIKAASGAPTSRTAILVITDGKDEHSHLNEQDVLNTVESSYIPIYTITLGKYKHVDAIKKISNVSGGYFLLSPNHNEIVQLGKIISDAVDLKYIVDFDLALPQGKHTGVVHFNHMGKELTAQKEFSVSPTAITIPPTATNVTRTTPTVELVSQAKWSDNRLMIVLLLLLGLSALCNVLLVLGMLRRPKLSLPTNVATTIDDIKRQIDAIGGKVSQERPQVPFEEIVHKLNDAGSKITTLTAEVRDLPKDDVSPLLGRIERELSKMATATGMVSERMAAVDTGIQGIVKDLITTSNKLPAVGTSIAEMLQQGIKGLSKEIAAVKDGISGDKSDSLERLSKKLDEIETFIAKTNDVASQKTDAGLKELSRLLQRPADTSMTQKLEALLVDIAREVAQLKATPVVVQGADGRIDSKIDSMVVSFKAITGRLDEIETFIAKTNDVASQKTDAGLKELARLLQRAPEWILAYTSTVQKLEAGLRNIAGEVRQLKDRPSVQGADGNNIDGMKASFKVISGRLDEIETFIAKTNSILKKQTQEGLSGLSTALGSSLSASMSTMLAAVQGRLQELEVAIETIARDLTQLRDNPPVMWPDNIKGSFDVISNRLDEIEAFIADTNNTMRQRSEERLLEFTQTIQSSIDTSVSEKMAVGIRNLNDELVSLRERLSDMPMDNIVRETHSSLDKFQGSLTEKLEVAIRGLYDELTLVKGKLPDMAIVSELGMKLELLSQQSSKVFSNTVDAVSEKTAVLSHDLGASLQTIAGTIDGIEDIIRNVSYNLSDDDNTGSVKAQIMAIRETMSDIIRFLLLVSDDDNTGSVKAQIMAIRETMSDIIRFLLLLSQR
ncbi:VWFA-like domain-containing protein [Candidatus Magnetobacterium bavaricum]|uniref:VWFA-like domain-containing protein n=1 Tax=Candidatus Magnetobacterium bavaricum TaxID=29290 RepID=A0A0F3GXW1_9BACT|nr:VWFA-like domain-containing protein [Candidatus Magnetobacterium bavaricum]